MTAQAAAFQLEEQAAGHDKLKGEASNGITASYYELPAGATELQHLISYRNLNAQDGEMFRAIYRKGRASHSDELRDARKVLFYAKAEVERLEKLATDQFGQQNTFDHRTEEQKAADPRTVAGVDVSFDTEKHLNFAPVVAGCWKCHGSGRVVSRVLNGLCPACRL